MTGETADRHPGEHAGQNDSEHAALDKDDVKGCFTGTLLVGCLTLGLMALLLMVAFSLMIGLPLSQDPNFP